MWLGGGGGRIRRTCCPTFGGNRLGGEEEWEGCGGGDREEVLGDDDQMMYGVTLFPQLALSPAGPRAGRPPARKSTVAMDGVDNSWCSRCPRVPVSASTAPAVTVKVPPVWVMVMLSRFVVPLSRPMTYCPVSEHGAAAAVVMAVASASAALIVVFVMP